MIGLRLIVEDTEGTRGSHRSALWLFISAPADSYPAASRMNFASSDRVVVRFPIREDTEEDTDVPVTTGNQSEEP